MDFITTSASWRAIDANTAISFQVAGAYSVEVARSAHNIQPTVGFVYEPGQGDRGDIIDLFPRSSGNTIWARSNAASAVVLG